MYGLKISSLEPCMYDILIGTASSESSASIGSHNKDSNYCFFPLQYLSMGGGVVVGAFLYWLRGLLLRLDTREFTCRQLFQSYFFQSNFSL